MPVAVTALPGYVLVAIAAAMWGSDALFRRGLALDLPAPLIVFVEHLLLTVMTLPLWLRGLRVVRAMSVSERMALLFIGAGASALATILFTEAFTYGDPTTPLLLQKVQPLIAVLGAWLFLGERLLTRYWLFMTAGLAGAFLITFDSPTDLTGPRVLPAALAVGAATLWALGTVFGRRLASRIAHSELTGLRFLVGLPVSGIVAWVLGSFNDVSLVGTREILALLLLALIPGLIALLLYYRGLSNTSAAGATLAELAFPLSAVLINYVAFGDSLTGTQWLGLVSLSATITLMGLASTKGDEKFGVKVPAGA